MPENPDPGLNIDTIRARLAAEAGELRAQGAASREDRAPVTLDQQSVGRLSRMDALQVQEMAKAAETRRQARLRQIQAALQRLDDGEFGGCLNCGEGIGAKRLELDPAVATCIKCARANSG